MKAIESDLVLEDFFIIDSNYKFIKSDDNTVNIKTYFKEYNIDIDFIVTNANDNKDRYIIYAKVFINQNENKLPGYSMFAESVSIYRFKKKSKLSDTDKSDLLWQSGVSISINYLRNYLTTKTAFCPLGKYTLPTLDLGKLLQTKFKELNKKPPAK